MNLTGTARYSRKWACSLRSMRSGTTPTGRMYIASSISPFPWSVHREDEDHLRPAPRFALDLDPSVVPRDHPVDDGKPRYRPVRRGGVERVEHPGQLLVGDAVAGVGEDDRHRVPLPVVTGRGGEEHSALHGRAR